MTDEEPKEPNPNEGKADTTEGRCNGCGRRLHVDTDPELLARGVLSFRVDGSPLPHDPTACVRAHGPHAGSLAYRSDGRKGGVPKKLPPRHNKKQRRETMRALGMKP